MTQESQPLKKRKVDAEDVEREVRASFLERFFAKYEFTCKHMLSCSDSESWTMKDVLQKADGECQNLWEGASLGYTESLGDPLLLQEIWQRSRGAVLQNLGKSSVADLYTEQTVLKITTCVPVEGIYVAMHQLLKGGDLVICLAPAYQALYEIARSKGCKVLEWQPSYDTDRNFWRFDIADLKALLANKSQDLKMLVLNSPHNPTGACFSQGQFDEISTLLGSLKQEEAPVLFSDEMYGDLLESRPSNVGKSNSIVLSGLSKPWGMPGLRMGWLMVENPKHFERVAAFRDYTTLCLPPQSEILSVIALRNPSHFLERNRRIARENYQRLQAFLLSLPDWFYPLNQHEHNSSLTDFAAVTLFARLKQPLGGFTGKVPLHLESLPRLSEHLAQTYSVCLVAGDFFEFNEFPCVRFGIGRANFPAALASLKHALGMISSLERKQ